ncbi:MAG: signal peptide peptidase SppA, partial [Psychromonas sp.]
VKAVVIRLDTPGGSAFASENIRQQVLALKAAGKKVVVSMGSVTASGGYWIASAADQIIASPTTLTGSIGIFGMFATIDKSLNKIGIQQDGVATNPLSNIGITQELTPELADIFQLGIENGYANFLQVVAEGREMSIKAVDQVAQGRVWTGEDALNNGLIDKLGNLQSAVQEAAQLTGLEEFDVITIEPRLSSKQVFFNQVFSKTIKLLPSGLVSQPSLLNIFAEIEQQSNFISRINDPQSRYVYCTQCYVE